MKKTFKSSSFCNISNFHSDFVWNPSRFKGHFLNELRVSFKNAPSSWEMYVIKNTFSVTHASYRLEDNLISCPFNRVFPSEAKYIIKTKTILADVVTSIKYAWKSYFLNHCHNPWQYDYSSYILLHAQVGGMIKEANPLIFKPLLRKISSEKHELNLP